METALISTVVDESMEFTVIATSPKDMEAGQRSLILWAARKIQSIKQELAEAQEQLAIAAANKWKKTGWSNQVRKNTERLEFYKKIKGALEAGYYIVPPFPVEVFAIRTDRSLPNALRGRHPNNHDQGAANLPIGEGNYVDPRPHIQPTFDYTYRDGKSQEVKMYYADAWKNVDFPFKLAKPEVMGETAKAMALKIFDRFGILPGTRKPDPIICGQIICPRQKKYARNPDVINFFVAWWLDTASLPK